MMDFNLFIKIFNNKSIRKEIVLQIKKIHLNNYRSLSFSWQKVLNLPHILVRYDYIDLLKKYIERYKDVSFYLSEYSEYIYKAINVSIVDNKYQVFVYLIKITSGNHFIKTQYQHMLIDCAHHGRLNFIKYIDSHSLVKSNEYDRALIESPASLNLELVDWLLTKVMKDFINTDGRYSMILQLTLAKAATVGSLDIIEHIIALPSAKDLNLHFTLFPIVSGGQVKLLDWLATKVTNLTNNPALVCTKISEDDGTQMLVNYIDEAAEKNHLPVVQWLHSHRVGTASTKAMDSAAYNGNLEMVQYLLSNRTEGCTTNAMDNAAFKHLEVVKWLHENRTEGCTTRAMDNAVYCSLELVKFLHENRTEGCSELAITRAVSIDKLDIVEYLFNNCTKKCTPSAMEQAATKNLMHMVVWLHNNMPNQETSIYAMDMAAQHGMEMVKWFHENRTEGCTSGALSQAIRSNHLDVFQFIYQNRPELTAGASTVDFFFEAASLGFVEMTKYIYENKIGLIKKDEPRYLSFLCEHAIQHDYNELLFWLIENSNNNINNVNNNYVFKIDIKPLKSMAKKGQYLKSLEILNQFDKNKNNRSFKTTLMSVFKK